MSSWTLLVEADDLLRRLPSPTRCGVVCFRYPPSGGFLQLAYLHCALPEHYMLRTTQPLWK